MNETASFPDKFSDILYDNLGALWEADSYGLVQESDLSRIIVDCASEGSWRQCAGLLYCASARSRRIPHVALSAALNSMARQLGTPPNESVEQESARRCVRICLKLAPPNPQFAQRLLLISCIHGALMVVEEMGRAGLIPYMDTETEEDPLYKLISCWDLDDQDELTYPDCAQRAAILRLFWQHGMSSQRAASALSQASEAHKSCPQRILLALFERTQLEEVASPMQTLGVPREHSSRI